MSKSLLSIVALLCLIASSCASTQGVFDDETPLGDRFSRFFDTLDANCGITFDENWTAIRWKDAYGAPACREDRGAEAYAATVFVDPEQVLGFSDRCSAIFPHAPEEDFQAVLAEAMQAEGFVEAFDVINLSFCAVARCNGRKYCRNVPRREFLRKSDNLLVTVSRHGENYPHLQHLRVRYLRPAPAEAGSE